MEDLGEDSLVGEKLRQLAVLHQPCGSPWSRLMAVIVARSSIPLLRLCGSWCISVPGLELNGVVSKIKSIRASSVLGP